MMEDPTPETGNVTEVKGSAAKAGASVGGSSLMDLDETSQVVVYAKIKGYLVFSNFYY